MSAPKKKSILAPESTADNKNEVIKEFREAQHISGTKVPLPNGKFVALEAFIDQDYRPGQHTVIFAEPEKFMKEPRPDCKYAWVAFRGHRSAELLAKVRSGAYRPVTSDETRTDVDIPIATHREAGLDFVVVYDVALVEVQPEAVKRLYKWREQQAVLKTVKHQAFEQYLNRAVSNASGGLVGASFTVKNENE